MQAKVMPEQSNTATAVYVGVDVCKERLDIHIHPQGESLSLPNDRNGCRHIKRILEGHAVARIVMEATSKYHRAAHRSLAAAGLPVALVNPLRARLFAQARGTFAKTDALDARILALLGEQLDPAVTPPRPEALENLQELVRSRDTAVAQRSAVALRRDASQNSFLRSELARCLRWHDRHIARLEAAIAALIAQDPILNARQQLLLSIPGIGILTAAAILANLPEIGRLSAKQASAIAGLAPFARDSGASKSPRHIHGGRADLRRALYLAALTAARFNPNLKHFYQHLKGAGKAPKLALIAVARKLLILANSLIAQNRPWTPIHP